MEEAHPRKRRWVVLALLVLGAVTAVGGYAYFTNSGSGSGTAAVGSASNIVLSSDAVNGLFPGGPDVTVTVHVSNPGSGNQFVNDISGTVANNGACLGAWFQVDTKHLAANVPAGTAPTTTTKVRMVESGTNQDACQGQTMAINWSSN